jgi:hypothetical protein
MPRVLGWSILVALGCPAATPTTTTPTPAETETQTEATTSESTTSSSTPSVSTWPTIEAKAPALSAKSEPGRPRGDRSKKLPDWETSWVAVRLPKDVDEGEVHGKVAEIGTGTGPRPLKITGKGGKTLELEIDGPGRLVVAVGDEVAVRWRRGRIQIHTVTDIAVLDAAGNVIYAGSANGDATFAPGWWVEAKGIHERGSPHMAGGARREERWLLLGRGDAAAFVRGGEGARRLSTPEGDYAVSGSAVTWSAGKRPPDSSSYETFGITRLP